MFDRECMMMIPKQYTEKGQRSVFRCLNIFKAEGIMFALNKMVEYKEIGKPVNVYASLARYESMPKMSPVMQFRRSDEEKFKEEHYHHMKSYDLLIDVDASNAQDMKFAKISANNIIKLLDRFSIPYYLRFSGLGYHFIIPYEVFKQFSKSFDPHLENEENIYSFYNRIVQAIHDDCSEMVDLGLHDSRRVAKVPYSLVHYPDGIFVCWPFKTKQEFMERTRDDFRLSTSMSFRAEQKIYRRGEILFNKTDWNKEKSVDLLQYLRVQP